MCNWIDTRKRMPSKDWLQENHFLPGNVWTWSSKGGPGRITITEFMQYASSLGYTHWMPIAVPDSANIWKESRGVEWAILDAAAQTARAKAISMAQRAFLKGSVKTADMLSRELERLEGDWED